MQAELKRAISCIKADDKLEGERLLIALLKKDPSNELAWLWLSSTVATLEQRRYCLEQAIHINPDNEVAQKALLKLSRLPTQVEHPAKTVVQKGSETTIAAVNGTAIDDAAWPVGQTTVQSINTKAKTLPKLSSRLWLILLGMLIVGILGSLRETGRLIGEIALLTIGEEDIVRVADRTTTLNRIGERAYYVHYSFSLENGRTINGSGRVSASIWANSPYSIRILYLPLYPAINRPLHADKGAVGIGASLRNFGCYGSALLISSVILLAFRLASRRIRKEHEQKGVT